MYKALSLVLFFIIPLVVGCDSKSNLDAPRNFFNENKIGSSADYGIIKWADPEDHVVSVHGFMDDLKSCMLISDALNEDACKGAGGDGCPPPFSCQPLNH